jgi:hypothetical protein
LGDDFRRTDPSEWNRDDFISRTDLQRAQSDLQAVRATGHRDGMAATDVSRESVFQRLDFRPHNETPVLKDTVDGFVDGRLEFEILGLKVDEIHGSVYQLTNWSEIHQMAIDFHSQNIFILLSPHEVFCFSAEAGLIANHGFSALSHWHG